MRTKVIGCTMTSNYIGRIDCVALCCVSHLGTILHQLRISAVQTSSGTPVHARAVRLRAKQPCKPGAGLQALSMAEEGKERIFFGGLVRIKRSLIGLVDSLTVTIQDKSLSARSNVSGTKLPCAAAPELDPGRINQCRHRNYAWEGCNQCWSCGWKH